MTSSVLRAGPSKDASCPICDQDNDAWVCVSTSEVQPRKDDVSICARCGSFLIFNDPETASRLFRSPSVAELAEILTVPAMIQAKLVVELIRQKSGNSSAGQTIQ